MANVDGRGKNKSKKNKKNDTTANFSTSQGNQGNKYRKRIGTSGATGQLYETRLLSLVLLRCLTDDEVEDFLLGSNVDGVGDLDDICLRFTYKSKQVAVFIQAKHKDYASKGIADSSLLNPKSKVTLLQCFESYLKVKENFKPDNSHNKLFNGDFVDLTFHFVVYTSAVNKISKEKIKQIDLENNDTFNKVKQIISCKDDDSTSGDIFQIADDDQNVNLLSNFLIDNEINSVAEYFVSAIYKKEKEDYDTFKKYANILVPDVVTLTENGDYYDASVNSEFFCATDEILFKLKNKIYKVILSNDQINAEHYLLNNLQGLISSDEESSQGFYLSKLIYRYILFDETSYKLTFNAKVKVNKNVVMEYSRLLERVQVSKVLVDKAIEVSGKELLNSNSAQFKIPKNAIDYNEIKKCIEKKSLFTNEMKIAKDFLGTLYYYTNQGQEKDVAVKLVNEIAQYHKHSDISTYTARTRADVAALKFHDKIQNWWLKDGKSYFLTKTCDYLEKLAFEIAQPFVDMLSFIYQHEIDQYHVQFQNQAMNYLDQINTINNRITNIITCSLMLTTMKLRQFFGGVCLFIDYKYLYRLHVSEWELLKKELKIKTNTVLILVSDKFQECEKGMADIAMWSIKNIVDAFEGKIVIVSDKTLSQLINNCVEINSTIMDKNNTLSDIATETQNTLLEYELEFQGHRVTFRDLINTDYSIINSEIVVKILKHEAFTIGHSLSNLNYEAIEDFYMPRVFVSRLFENKVYELNTFKDMPRNINIITAEAGMGKSTMLTHLSLETKKEYPQKWIIRMNLVDYSDEFDKLRTEVNQMKFMKLVIMSEFKDIMSKFCIEDVDGNVTVEYIGNDPGEAIALKIMMKCYSQGDMIFIFDGFDEICPDYQTQVTNFIKNIDYDRLTEGDRNNSSLHLTELSYPSDTNHFQIWITSRPYNLIIQHLEKEFGTSFIMKPLTSTEQNIFYEKYWNVHFKIQEVDKVELNNILTFFDFMGQFLKNFGKFLEHFLATDVPLYEMYISALQYLKNLILCTRLKIDTEEYIASFTKIYGVSDKELRMEITQSELARRDILRTLEQVINSWVSNKNFIAQYKLTRGDMTAAEKIVGVPLYMDMAATYFVAEIKSDSPKSQTDWDLGFTTINYYKRIVELKLKLRFEDKNSMIKIISIPAVKSICEAEKKRIVNDHKKLAFYSMFRRSKYLEKLLIEEDWQEIEITMQKIKDGKEKTGFIECIHNKVPRFFHLSFAEYFAVEFLVDIIILSKPELIEITMDLILNYLMRQSSTGLMTMFNQKLKYDGTKLREVLERGSVKKVVFKLMWDQRDWKDVKLEVVGSSGEVKTRAITPALNRSIDIKLLNVTMFLLRSIDGNLTKDNIEIFIEEILERTFFYVIMLIDHPELIDYVLNKIREVDVVYIKNVINVCKLHFEKMEIEKITNEEILDALVKKLKTKKKSNWLDDFDEYFGT